MLLTLLTQIPESTIRNAVTTVFQDPDFNQITLWQRFMAWLQELFFRFLGWIFHLLEGIPKSPVLYWSVITLLVLLLIAVIARVGYLWYAERLYGADALKWKGVGNLGGSRNPWQAAQELSARGNFTEAAHALYLALLETAAQQRQVRIHPSKTVGDYVRELRSKSSRLFNGFRDFARSYETVIYGIGYCDEARYQRLYALAVPIVRPHD